MLCPDGKDAPSAASTGWSNTGRARSTTSLRPVESTWEPTRTASRNSTSRRAPRRCSTTQTASTSVQSSTGSPP
jgi:hypothetical protein